MAWRDWLRRGTAAASREPDLVPAPAPVPVPVPDTEPEPAEVQTPSGQRFELAAALSQPHGLPLLDWNAAHAWLDTLPEAEQAAAWTALQRAWLLHLRAALGPGYRLRHSDGLLLLSALPDRPAALVQGFVRRCRQRLLRLLDGLAEPPAGGADVLIVFDTEDAYYRYTSAYLPEGDYGMSGGMHIHAGCSHFAVPQASLPQIEPVIAHELTHAGLSHLPIPAWLNEGLAVGCERQICPPAGLREPPLQRHRAFWSPARLQDFWCGRSFLQPDDAQELSYALATLLVQALAAYGWPRFRDFARAAQADDAGAAAARDQLGLDLGAALAHLLGRDDAAACAPQPARWEQAPERGAF
jgi:hypothetical protein